MGNQLFQEQEQQDSDRRRLQEQEEDLDKRRLQEQEEALEASLRRRMHFSSPHHLRPLGVAILLSAEQMRSHLLLHTRGLLVASALEVDLAHLSPCRRRKLVEHNGRCETERSTEHCVIYGWCILLIVCCIYLYRVQNGTKGIINILSPSLPQKYAHRPSKYSCREATSSRTRSFIPNRSMSLVVRFGICKVLGHGRNERDHQQSDNCGREVHLLRVGFFLRFVTPACLPGIHLRRPWIFAASDNRIQSFHGA